MIFQENIGFLLQDNGRDRKTDIQEPYETLQFIIDKVILSESGDDLEDILSGTDFNLVKRNGICINKNRQR